MPQLCVYGQRLNLKSFARFASCCVVLCLFVASVLPVTVTAADSKVGASLFSTTDPPTVTVDTPPPTSTTNNPQLTISGTTINTTEIRIYLNGNLVATLDATWGSFSTVITLPEQTSTILIVAYSSYSDLTTETTRIVTYLPAVTPGEDDDDDGGSDGDNGPGAPNTGFMQKRSQRLFYVNGSSGYAVPVFYWIVVLASLVLFLSAVLPTRSNPLLKILLPRAQKKSATPEEYLRGSFFVGSIICLVVFLL